MTALHHNYAISDSLIVFSPPFATNSPSNAAACSEFRVRCSPPPTRWSNNDKIARQKLQFSSRSFSATPARHRPRPSTSIASPKFANRTVINSTVVSTSQLGGGQLFCQAEVPAPPPLPLGLLLLNSCRRYGPRTNGRRQRSPSTRNLRQPLAHGRGVLCPYAYCYSSGTGKCADWCHRNAWNQEAQIRPSRASLTASLFAGRYGLLVDLDQRR